MRIAFYVSDYGYGHATRTIRVIRKALSLFQDIEFLVVSAAEQITFMQVFDNTTTQNLSYMAINTLDAGLSLNSDGTLDKSGTKKKVENWVDGWEKWVHDESTELKKQNIDLILTDISPLPVLLGKHLDIPVIGISNFTWYDQYAGLLDEPYLQKLENAYNGLAYFLKYPLSMPLGWLNVRTSKLTPFWSVPEIDMAHVAKIREQLIHDKRKIIFIGFGRGYSNQAIINLSGIKADFIFASTTGDNITADNYIKLKPSDNHYKYMAASDLIISKAGWGTVNEAISANVPIYIIKRDIPEDTWTIGEVERSVHGKGIEFSDLLTEIKSFI